MAVVITESAAEKLKSYKVEEVFVSVNGNDVLLNLYDNDQAVGDTEGTVVHTYHSFPKVGEHTKGNVLVASRREERNSILYNFQYDKMTQIEPTDDVTYTNGGIVADLDIFCNAPLEFLEKSENEFTQELVTTLKTQNAYYAKAAKELEKILPVAKEAELMSTMSKTEKDQLAAEKKEYGFNWLRPQPRSLCKNKYTEEFGYFWKIVHEYNDNRIKWRTKGKTFNNFKLKFTILKENPITIGCKVSN